MNLSKTTIGMNWVNQFDFEDQELAINLLDSFMTVNSIMFIDRLRELVINEANKINGPVGLYAEREIRKRLGKPNRLFKEELVSKRMRAYGAGPKPIKPLTTINPQVGSEGIIATLITELCRENNKKFYSHPGPDQIRDKRIRSLFVLTDFIGSGDRARNYVGAAWRIASVKSWLSYKLLNIKIIAYSATSSGFKAISRHPSKPECEIVSPCPTIESEFRDNKAQIRSLCIKYAQKLKSNLDPLGHGGAEALISFAHGCPNNVPIIFHKTKLNKWNPLFPSRVTAKLRAFFNDEIDDTTLEKTLERLGQKVLANNISNLAISKSGKKVLLVLSALKKAPRLDIDIARRTRINIAEVRNIMTNLISWGWVTSSRRLTDMGFSQLQSAKYAKKATPPIPNLEFKLYYPKLLRVPYGTTS